VFYILVNNDREREKLKTVREGGVRYASKFKNLGRGSIIRRNNVGSAYPSEVFGSFPKDLMVSSKKIKRTISFKKYIN